MCIFSGSTEVGATKIFARNERTGAGPVHQWIAYQMEYSASDPVAMILPIPVQQPAAEDAVLFKDMSNYRNFFADLDDLFPKSRGIDFSKSFSLKVHEIGDYEASFAPSKARLADLDPKFQLPESVWSKLPEYDKYGFVVAKLKPGSKEIHPLAFRFTPSGHLTRLFFPTVHVHDGVIHPTAEFNHQLYYQGMRNTGCWGPPLNWMQAQAPADPHCELLRPDLALFRTTLHGNHANADVVVWL